MARSSMKNWASKKCCCFLSVWLALFGSSSKMVWEENLRPQIGRKLGAKKGTKELKSSGFLNIIINYSKTSKYGFWLQTHYSNAKTYVLYVLAKRLGAGA